MNYTEILSLTRTLSREEQLQLAVCLTQTQETEGSSAILSGIDQ